MSTSAGNSIETRDQLREVLPENKANAVKINDHLDRFAKDFLQRCPFLVLATCSAEGHADASPKGDAPGFVLVEDDHTLIVPDRPGNKLAMGHENIISNPRVGLLCMIPGTDETLRINGRAELSRDPELLDRLAARGRPAVLALRVTVEECFFHCPKAFVRSKLWDPSEWGERYKVSFGEMIAEKLKADADVARQIDEAVEENVRTEL